MTAKESGKKWTAAEIKEHTARIQAATEKFKHEGKKQHFLAITPEEIEKKFKRVNSPFIVSQGWNDTTPGGTVNLAVGIYNPDPTEAIWLFAYVAIGSGNVDPVTGTYLLNVDPRFPRLTEPQFAGLTLAPGASTQLNYALQVPATVDATNYLGNTTLMQFNWFDVGTFLDRANFVFNVS
jgi:hypothetical protein